MATKIFYGRYWADIHPVRSWDNETILYWRYRIYEANTDRFEMEGLNATLDMARAAAESQIDRLMAEPLGDLEKVA
jgi:hypothetical protein